MDSRLEGYEAAQSELTALREELATMTADRNAEKRMKACARIQRDVQTVLAQERQERLTAAEQRNSELVECAEELADLVEASLGCDYTADSFTTQPIRNALAAIKPTESGATDPCAHSYANKLGCPECGEEFKQDELGASE
jgi:hypothetical protein